MKLSLAPLALTLAIVTLAASASAEKPKHSATPKVHVCESIDLYVGSVDSKSAQSRITESCADVSIKSATRMVQKCSAEGAASCEVIKSADGKTLMIEHKIVTSAGAK